MPSSVAASSTADTGRAIVLHGLGNGRRQGLVGERRPSALSHGGAGSARRYSHAHIGAVNSTLADDEDRGALGRALGRMRDVFGACKLPHSPFWLKRATPVVATILFELFDVGSDVNTYVTVVAPSPALSHVFKRNYLAWCCLSVLVSLVAVMWYVRSLAIGYKDYKHNVLASSTIVVSQDAINVVAVKSRLQVSMVLVVVEDLPSVGLNGWVLFGLEREQCVAHSWVVLAAFIASCFSVGYKLAAYQTFWQFRRVLDEWEHKRGVIDVLEQAFERHEEPKTRAVWLRVREPAARGGSPGRREAGAATAPDDDRPHWHGLVTDSVLNVGALANPRLVRMDVSSLAHIGDATWEALERHCPQMRELSAWGFGLVSDGHGCGAPLTVLSAHTVSDAVVSLACAMCPQLAFLDLSHCALTDGGVAILAERAPELRELILSFARSISDACAYDLSVGAPRLRRLNLRCTAISDEVADALRAREARRERPAALHVEGPSDWLLHSLEWTMAQPEPPHQPHGARPEPTASARVPLSPISRAAQWQVLRRRGSLYGKALTLGVHSARSSGSAEPMAVVRVRRALASHGAWTDDALPPSAHLTDAHLFGLAIRRPDVAVLDLTRCSALSGQAAHALAQLGSLRRLSLRECARLQLRDVRVITQGCGASLQQLDLEGTWQARSVATDPADMRLLLEACPQLQLFGCNRTSLDDACVHMLAFAAGALLAELRAWACDHLTRDGAGMLRHHRPHCELVLECRTFDPLRGLNAYFPQLEPAAGAPGTAGAPPPAAAAALAASPSAARCSPSRAGGAGDGLGAALASAVRLRAKASPESWR